MSTVLLLVVPDRVARVMPAGTRAVVLAALVGAATAGCSEPVAVSHSPESSSAAAQAAGPAPLPVTGRSMVTTRYGIVAASSPLAARAGTQMLERGGHAVDAAIAANAVLNVVEPAMNGIGGDLFAIVYDAKSDQVFGLNASGWTPAALTAERLRQQGLTELARDIHAVTVPGAVAGWDALHSRFGRLALRDSLAPAMRYAEEGFPVSDVVAREWDFWKEILTKTDNAKATYLVDGTRAPAAGEIFRNPDLARSLRRIAANGRDGFYRGETAEAILALSASLGGTMTADDLTAFEAEWVAPIETTYRGWTVSEIPPNSQGIAALMMLDIMAQSPIGEWGFHSPRAMHTMIEAKKLAYADMLRYVGDPRGASVPVSALLSPEHAKARAALIDPQKAACAVEPAQLAGVTTSKGNDTIYLTVIDREGNIVSLIQSIYQAFGSGLVPEGTGFALHNRGQLFTLEAGHPNELGPRKRPVHTIIPAFMRKDDMRVGFGIMGGWNQAQAHAQFVSNIADHGMNLQQALEAGRFTKATFDGCDVQIEPSVPAATRDALTALGHQLKVEGPRTGIFGWGQAVMGRANGVHFGASEPRHDGAAIPEAPQ
ncbi:MAG: gamma-glutamyltransferase [Vicinamibacteria bacterium]